MDQSQLNSLAPEMSRVISMIEQVFRRYAPPGFVVEFTAGKEWFHHAMWSLHHSGNAVDVRTRTLPDGGVGGLSIHIATVLQRSLDSGFGPGQYRVLRNDAGPSKPHIHVQYNKGGRWSEPGDFGARASRIA
jgi:hypothetical protein